LIRELLITRLKPDLVYSNSWADGKISILRLKGSAGDFEVLDAVGTGGKGLNSMAVLPDGSAILGAHVSHYSDWPSKADDKYGSGSAVHIPLSPDGLFLRSLDITISTSHLPPSSFQLDHPRQDAPHAHQIVIHGDVILIPDLGSNSVTRQYPPRDGGEWVLGEAVLGYEAGDGPRHVAVHPKGIYQV
jgi:6-phosphogluconolactonase